MNVVAHMRELGAYTWFCFVLLSVAIAGFEAFGMDSGNIVGFQTQEIKRGINTVSLPRQINQDTDRMTVAAALKQFGVSALVEGDEVLALDGIGNEEWGILEKDDDGALRPISPSGIDLSNWLLPCFGGDFLLKIRRAEDEVTKMSLPGEFDIDCPINLSTYVPTISLSKIKLERRDGDMLPAVITNRVDIPFPTLIPKKFDVVTKDGRRIRAFVNPESRLIVDAKFQKPIDIDVSEIKSFSQLKDSQVPADERMTQTELREMTKVVSEASVSGGLIQAVRKGMFGVLWNDERPWCSIGAWALATGGIALVQLVWNAFWMIFARLIRLGLKRIWRLIMNATNTMTRITWTWILLFVVGLVLVGAGTLCSEKWNGALASVGLSIVASVVCGWMVDIASSRARRERAQKMRAVYFSELSRELRMLLGNLLWYVDRLPDRSFDWSKPPEWYWKRSQLVMLQGRWSSHDIASGDFERVVNELRVKFSLESMEKLSQAEYDKVVVLFEIVMFAAGDLMKCCVDLHQQRLALAYEDVFSLEDSKGLIWTIVSAYEVQKTARACTRRNFGFVIENLAKALKIVESGLTSRKSLRISLSCPYAMTLE